MQFGGSGDEGVMQRVLGLVPIAQDGPAVVVQTIGIPVVDRAPGITIARSRKPDELRIVHAHRVELPHIGRIPPRHTRPTLRSAVMGMTGEIRPRSQKLRDESPI
jgi:hypothetical protein